MTLGEAGQSLIKSFETCRLVAYQDQRGVWTCGWGHTGPDVTEFTVCTQDQADAWFLTDTAWACRVVSFAVAVPLVQHEFDALVSLAFNIGAGSFNHSTLVKLLNAGDRVGAAAQFLVWNHVDGVPNDGLTRRRIAEQALFIQAPTQN